jgi:Surface-adhesin protein E
LISKIWLRNQKSNLPHLFLTIVLIGTMIFVFFPPQHAFAAEWKIYAGTDEGLFYYDAESITQLSAGIVHFRHKATFTEQGIGRVVEALGQEYQNLAYSISVREMNCSEKKIRSLGVTYFSTDGKTLDVAVDFQSEWHFIEPTAMIEGLFQKLCKP